MARKKKAKLKTSKVEARVSDRLAYGVEIAARKAGMSMSGYLGRALEEKLAREGLDRKDAATMRSPLDDLWSPEEWERLVRLAAHAPELLSEEDQTLLGLIMRSPVFFTNGEAQDVDDMPLRGGFVRGENVGVCWGSLLQVARGETPAPDWNAEIDAHHAHVATGSPAPGWSSPDDF